MPYHHFTKMKINIGITQKNLKSVSDLLHKTLSDQHVLYVKTRNFHWNLVSTSFTEHHRLLEEQYKQLEEAIDSVAERIRTLGSNVEGSMETFLKGARLKESPNGKKSWKIMFEELLNDHEACCRQLRKDIDSCDSDFEDIGTADFLTGLLQDHEKMAWFLRNYMEE